MTELTGTAVLNTAHANSSQALTIPADATAVLVFAWGWRQSYALNFATLNFDGSGMDFAQVTTNADTTDPYDVWAYIQTNEFPGWPGTGSGKTLTWTFNNAPQEGGSVAICFLKNLATDDPVIDIKNQKGGATFTATLDGVESDDLTFVVAVDYTGSGTPTASGASHPGQTVLLTNTTGDNATRWVIAYEPGESTPTAAAGTLNSQGQYTGYIAFSIANAPTPTGLQPAWAAHCNQVLA